MADISRWLITGSTGMVGQAIPFGVKLSRHDLDITDPARVKAQLDQIAPAGILCLSSLDMRRCEKEPYQALQTNVLGVYGLAKEAASRKIPIVLISSGAVFNGPLNASFDEKAVPAPLNLYGQTKCMAELLISHITDNHLIIRTGWLFGKRSAHHLNFIDRAFDLAKRNEPIEGSTDQTGSPTYLKDFVGCLEKLLVRGDTGTVHIVNSDPATGFDLAREIVTITKSRSVVKPIRARDVPNLSSKRSESEILVSSGVRLRSWREALRDYLENEK